GRLRRQERLGGLKRVHLLAAINDERLLTAHSRIGDHREGDLEAVLEVTQMAALVIEYIKRNVGPGAHDKIVRGAPHQDLFEPAQELQCDRGYRADMSGAAALRAGLGRTLKDAGTNSLARHFQQPEMRNPSDLDTRAVLPQAVRELALHRTIVALLVHVDEIDDDQAGKVAQAELTRDFPGSLQIGLKRG